MKYKGSCTGGFLEMDAPADDLPPFHPTPCMSRDWPKQPAGHVNDMWIGRGSAVYHPTRGICPVPSPFQKIQLAVGQALGISVRTVLCN